MKRIQALAIILIVLGLLFSPLKSKAQFGMLGYGEMTREGLVSGGIGVTSIDDQTFYTLSFHPELSLGKFGIGLNLDLLFNNNNLRIRQKDWNESYDYFRMLRYLRYGWKGDDVYLRVGTLDAARIGHGFIMNYYTNEAEWDERKIGLEFDLNFGQYGFESVTSNLGRMEIIGGRFYLRPLQKAVSIPIIRNLTFGGTFVTDRDPDKDKNTKDALSIYGGDVELPFIDSRILWTGVYADYAKIKDYGSGKAVGFGLQLKNLLGIVHLETRFERRWLGKQFIPSYFNAFYEIDRSLLIEAPNQFHNRESLALIQNETKGYFGEFYAKILGLVHILGNFQRLDDMPQSGELHFAGFANKGLPGIAFQAAYDKINIGTFEDVFTLDNRSIARASVGYKIKPYLILFMDYIWSFVQDEESGNFKPQERVQPRLAFSYNFSL